MKKLIETTTAAKGTGDYSPPLELKKKRKLVYCRNCNKIIIDKCPDCKK